MTQSQAEAVLSKYYPLLRDVVIDGFTDYAREYGHVSFKHHARSRATLIHDHIVHYAKERLLALPEFQLIPTKIRNLFDVSGELIVQFKKLSRSLRTSNITTQFTLTFDAQEEIYSLPGIPPSLPRLALGYVPRSDWTAVEGVYLTYSCAKNLVWYLDLTLVGQPELLTPLEIEFNEQPVATPKRVRAKSPRRKRGGDTAASL